MMIKDTTESEAHKPDYTREQKERMLSELEEIFRRCLTGSATVQEIGIAEKFSSVINKGKYSVPNEEEAEEQRKEIWANLAQKLDFINNEQYIKKDPRKRWEVPVRTLYRYGTVAAMVVMVFISGYLMFRNMGPVHTEQIAVAEQTIYIESHDEVISRTLDDGTKVSLNKGSRLGYRPATFNHQRRDVWMEGEVFFEVAKNPAKPFTVNSNGLAYTVLGTSFNIKAYDELGEKVISVRTGKVKVSSGDKQLGTLTRNMQLTYNNTNQNYTTGNADFGNAAGWMEGSLVLQQANIDELKLRLKQCYQVNTEIKGVILKDVMFNSSFANGTTLQEVMETIGAVYGVKFEIIGNRVIMSD